MEKKAGELFKSNVDPNSVLGVLKRSMESLHSLRQNRKSTPGRLQIAFCPDYSLLEKALSNCKEKSIVTASTSTQISPLKQSIRSTENSKNNLSTISRTQTPDPKRFSAFSHESKSKNPKFFQNLSKKINFSPEVSFSPRTEIISKAKAEIHDLSTNQDLLQSKIRQISDSLDKLSTAHYDEQNAMLSILNKLDTLESLAEQAHDSKKMSKIPAVLEKVSKLESNYSFLKSHNSDSLKNFREEMKEVNHKLQDLKECGEILKELVICLGKEPNVSRKNVQNAETFMESEEFVKEATVSLDKMHPDNVLSELMKQKEILVMEKERMESEYRGIPQGSKSMSNKRRKQTLELELSLNYSKLMSVNNKIKRFTN